MFCFCQGVGWGLMARTVCERLRAIIRTVSRIRNEWSQLRKNGPSSLFRKTLQWWTPSIISSFPHLGLFIIFHHTVVIVKSFHLNKFSLRIPKDLSAITGNVFLMRDYLLFAFPLGQCSFRCRTQNNMCLLATWRFLFMGNQRLQACAEWIWCKQNNMQLWSFDHICVTDGSLWLRSKSVIFFKAIRTRLKPVSVIQECTSRT